ncbi:hypothetical protein O0544_19605 [Edwardsiella anguillarum]|nr:hypothetical protein [Edwardsiella anguillarum]
MANHGGLSFSAALDAQVSGTPGDPSLRLLPGALLRIWGKTDDQTTLQEVRWPLAGCVSAATASAGVSRPFCASATATGVRGSCTGRPGRGVSPR